MSFDLQRAWNKEILMEGFKKKKKKAKTLYVCAQALALVCKYTGDKQERSISGSSILLFFDRTLVTFVFF